MNLVDTARLVAGYEALEQTTFVLLGGWVPSTPEVESKALLAEQAHHHAWHASLWRERRPNLGGAVVVAAEPHPFGELLAELDRREATLDRLVGACRVLAGAREGLYRAHLAASSALSDGPVIRALELVLADQARDREAAEAVLARLVASRPDGAEAIGRLVVELAPLTASPA